jgi:predicted phage terminase large subunit-like protein
MRGFFGDKDPIEHVLYLRSRLRGAMRVWAEEALRGAGQQPAAHHVLLLNALERVARGQLDRLMVLMPPGSAKSTYASVLFPAWWFTQHPVSSIICASHSLHLAQHFSRRVRDLIISRRHDLGYSISPNQRTRDAWTTTTGGEYLAIGVRGAVAGRRADLVLIDDPIKSRADAESLRAREHVWEWYRSDISTRLRPGGRVVLIMTRWHQDDLGGRLLETAPDDWNVLRLPALAEANDPLGRAPGTALWPEWEDREALLRKREMIGERAWSALFQQLPQPSDGRVFLCERIGVINDAPDGEVTVRAWDLASTQDTGRNDPDWTVGVKMSRDVSGRYVVLHVARIRGTPHQVEHLIVTTAREDGKAVLISIPEDPGQAGRSQISYLVRQLAAFHVHSSRDTGAKATRAMPLASQVEAGNVSILRADWNKQFLNELQDFPWGRKDDQVDALVRAFHVLATQRRTSSVISVPLLGR